MEETTLVYLYTWISSTIKKYIEISYHSGKELACQYRRYETQVRSLGWKDPLEKGLATYSNILAILDSLRTHGQRSLIGYSSWNRTESDMTEAIKHSTQYKPWKHAEWNDSVAKDHILWFYLYEMFRSRKTLRTGED